MAGDRISSMCTQLDPNPCGQRLPAEGMSETDMATGYQDPHGANGEPDCKSFESLNLQEDRIASVTVTANSQAACGMAVEEITKYDVFLIHEQNDDLAEKFRVLLERCVLRSDGTPISVCTELDLLHRSTNRLELLQLALQQGSRHFIFLRESIGEDSWFRFSQNQALVYLIQNNGQIVNIKESDSVRVPLLLGLSMDYSLSRLLRGKRLNDIDVEALRVHDLEPAYLNYLQRLCTRSNAAPLAFQGFARPSPVYVPLTCAVTPVPQTAMGRMIAEKFHFLSEHMDTEHGLLGQLFSREVISFKEMEGMRRARTTFEANEQLLRKMKNAPEKKMEAFVQALHDTNQSHIVKVLNGESWS